MATHALSTFFDKGVQLLLHGALNVNVVVINDTTSSIANCCCCDVDIGEEAALRRARRSTAASKLGLGAREGVGRPKLFAMSTNVMAKRKHENVRLISLR